MKTDKNIGKTKVYSDISHVANLKNAKRINVELDEYGNPILTFEYVQKICEQFYGFSNPTCIDQLPLMHKNVHKI